MTKSILEMSANEYRALIENPATNDDIFTEVMHIPANPAQNNELAQRRRLNDERDKAARSNRTTIAKLDLIPDRAPTGEELRQFEADTERFVAEYSQYVPSVANRKVLVDFLGEHHAIPSYRNLVTAFSECIAKLELRIEETVEVKPGADNSPAPRSLATNLGGSRRKPAPPVIATGVQTGPILKMVKARTLKPGEIDKLDAATYSRLTRPIAKIQHASFEEQRVQQLSASAYFEKFIPKDIPQLVRARIDRAVDEFISACPDFDKSDPSNAEIVKLYMVKHDLPWDSSMSYISAWRHYRSVPAMQQHLPEQVINEVSSGATTIKTTPTHHGFDPIAEFVIDKTLLLKLNAMSGIEYNEYLARHPEVRAAIDSR